MIPDHRTCIILCCVFISSSHIAGAESYLPLIRHIIPKPHYLIFPHNDILTVADIKSCVLIDLPTKNVSVLFQDDGINYIVKHPQKPFILASTKKELALYDIVHKTKLWNAPPIHENSSATFNTTTEHIITYHNGMFTFYNSTSDDRPISHTVPFDEKNRLNTFCWINYNKNRDELMYISSDESFSCISCQDLKQIKQNYITNDNSILLNFFDCSNDGESSAIQCPIMGCYLYPPAKKKSLKIFCNPIYHSIVSRSFRFHPYRNIVAILEGFMITYVNKNSGKEIAYTYPYRKGEQCIVTKTLNPRAHYQIDFSPDGKRIALRAGCLMYNVPPNSIITIFQAIGNVTQDVHVMRRILSKFLRILMQDCHLEKLKLLQLIRS